MDVASPSCNLWCDYVHTQFDPAHLLSELGFNLFFDFLILFLVWGKLIKPRLIAKIHREIDEEHGLEHQDGEPDRGCCTNCNGTRRDAAAPETNGKCWDCYGTGHTHNTCISERNLR